MTAASNTNNNDLKEARALLQELNILKRKLSETPFTFTDAELLKQFKDLPGYIDKSRRQLEGMSDSMSGLYGSLRGITSEFKGQATVLNKVRGAFRQLEDIAQDLKFDEQEINDLNASQLKKLEQKFKRNQQILEQEARSLTNSSSAAKDLEKEVQGMRQIGANQQDINDYVTDYLKTVQTGLAPEEKALLQLYYDQGHALEDISIKVAERIQKEKDINKALGLGGAAVQGINSLMGQLGMNSGIFSDAVQEAEEAMRNAAKDGGSRLQVLMAGLGPLAKGLGKALTDPLTIITAILEGFFRVNKASVDLQRLTGQYETSIAGVNSRLATSAQFLETAAELTRQWGVSATLVFSPDQIAQLAEAKNLLGLSAEQAGRMGILMKTTGKSADEVGQGIYDTVNAYNGANRAGISHGVVLQDILETSDSVTASFGKSEKKLGAAAVAARALGLSLTEVDAIAGNLVNFEDSISAELEAQLLTGKDINLAKAREFAMTNDLEGLSKELAKNGATGAEYAEMNRFQQEALAKALGMSRDQLAKSVLTQEAMTKMTDEQIAKARGVTLEQSKAMDVQQKMQVGMQKLAEAFAPLLDIIVNLVDAIMFFVKPIAEVIAMVTGNPIGKALLLAVVAANFLGVAVSGVGRAFGSMYQLGAKALTGLTGLFKQGNLKGALVGLKDQFKGAFGVGAGNMVQAKSGKFYGKDSPQGKMITNLSSKTGDVATEAKDKVAGKEGGTGFKDSMKNLADGLKKMGAEGVGKGIFNLAMAGPALVLALPSIPFLLFMGKVSLTTLYKNFSALGRGLKTMEGTLAGSGALLAFAGAGLLAVASIPFLVTIALIGTAAGVGLKGLAAGLKALGKGAGEIIIGIGLLALFNVALIPLGYALGLAAPAIEAFGKAIKSAFEGIATLIPVIVDGFVTLISSLGGSLGPMLLLGPALFGIAAGLGAIALAGFMAIPAIGGLVILAAVSPALVSLADAFGLGGESKSVGEAKGKSEEGSMATVEKKLDELIAAVKAGGNVYMDSNKVGRAQVLGSYKSS